MAMFYAVYGPLARTRTFAIVNSSLFFASINYLGRVDLIAAYALDIVVLFALALHVQAFTHCMGKVFGRTDVNYIFSAVATLALLGAVIAVNNRYSSLQQAAAGWFFIPVALFSYLLPASAWLLPRKRRRLTHGENGRGPFTGEEGESGGKEAADKGVSKKAEGGGT